MRVYEIVEYNSKSYARLQNTGNCSNAISINRLEVRNLVSQLRVDWTSTDAAMLRWKYEGHSDEKFRVSHEEEMHFRNALTCR